MSNDNIEISTLWEEIKVLVETIEIDIKKNVAGNKSAGVRARKGLRQLKKNANDLVKSSISNDKV
tara:strand:+ start:146 stop:340 length:195 start_codon:yes stop_codon:yes gene_type:complete